VVALAEAGADPARLVERAARECGFSAPGFALGRVEDEDWVRRSEEQFAPIRAGARLWVVPTWHACPDPAAVNIRLDPGRAFGTGAHPSTRLVLGWLERAIAGGERLLDYGCGSGILAIAGARLGARAVTAVDIDPQAREAAAANARANGVALEVRSPEELPAPAAAACYDVVVANILAAPLVALAPELAARTRGGGRVALSGILAGQAAEVAAAYARDFDVSVAAGEEGWQLVEGRRR
jgi:ribosomal protein L11 methyltransferase